MGNNPKEKTKEKNQPNSFIRFSGMATQMAIIIGLGVYGGIKADDYFAFEKPILTLVGSLLGVVLAIYYVIKDLSK